ncbi:transmembrane protein 164 [Diabrotica undecimpunctata]|uniref:transmembrane protein 164 n=1 Tax=Diabrotica undecimpunctata TaxID=50387 RepID=UPI003B642A04
MDWEWILSGVNKTVPRNAGQECAGFLNPYWRYVDTSLVLVIVYWIIKWSYPKLSLPLTTFVRRDRFGKRILLVSMCIIWGMEIGYKFSSRTVIYVLNPCHVTTAIQIYLLAAAPSRAVTAVFRFHLNLLNGPLLAFVFPETDTRLLPLETAIYWIQHGMMVVVPYYLLRVGGVYNVEKYSDISWNAMSYGINLLYHFIILQVVAIPTEVNLNHMLCPAILDPFDGQFYRLAAVCHQAVLCPALCKLFCLVSDFFLTKFKFTRVKSTLGCEVFATPNGDTTDVNHLHAN